MRRLLMVLLILVFPVSLAFSQAGNVRFVAVESETVKSTNNFFAQDLGTLRLGEQVTVLRESGRWTEVRAAQVSGWVSSASLSVRRVVSASAAVTPAEVALAGKGFSREVEAAYRSEGVDFSLVDEMERLVVPAAQLRRFIVDGRLAGGE